MRDISSQYRLWQEKVDLPFSLIIGMYYFTFISVEIYRLTYLCLMEANLLGIAKTNRVFHSPQYKNANIVNFDLTVPSEMNKANEVCNLEIYVEIQCWQ